VNVVQAAFAATLLTRAGDREGAAMLLDDFADTGATVDELTSVRMFVDLFDWPGLCGCVPTDELQARLLAEAAA
jgi:hypothetical protein